MPLRSALFALALRTVLACLCLAVLSPACAQDFTLGEARVLPEPQPALPIYDYAPDGHYTVFRMDGALVMFWPGHDSYRSTGASIFEMRDCVKVLPMGAADSFDNGGAWLFSIFPREGKRLLGFYHAEDHKFAGDPQSKWTAYKSIARCESSDGGLTWSGREHILTAHAPKPEKPAWSGLGDHCTVWDETHRRFVCIFQEEGNLCAAMSADAEGRAGSWRKWFAGDFTEPGLGGRATPLPTLARHRGGNPSVIWNTFLNRWVMAWHRWEGDLWISTSEDLLAWTPPKLLLGKTEQAPKVWYPTFIGETDKTGGETLQLLYAEFPDSKSAARRFLARTLTFTSRGESKP